MRTNGAVERMRLGAAEFNRIAALGSSNAMSYSVAYAIAAEICACLDRVASALECANRANDGTDSATSEP